MSALTSLGCFVLVVGLLVSTEAEAQHRTNQQQNMRPDKQGEGDGRSESNNSKEIKLEPGQDAVLPCVSPVDATTVEWNRRDLDRHYVFFQIGDKPKGHRQHESFKGRVFVPNKWKQNRNVSLTLKDVTNEDSGTYECEVRRKGKELPVVICTVTLTVQNKTTQQNMCPDKQEERDCSKRSESSNSSPGNEEEHGSLGLVVGLVAAGFVLVAVIVGVVLYKKLQKKKKSLPPDDDSTKHQLV